MKITILKSLIGITKRDGKVFWFKKSDHPELVNALKVISDLVLKQAIEKSDDLFDVKPKQDIYIL
jgi:hypothetical protein